jgi:ribonuclease HI
MKYIIDTLSIQVKLPKVKAHSSDPLNDQADLLAKESLSIASPTIINKLSIPTDLHSFARSCETKNLR